MIKKSQLRFINAYSLSLSAYIVGYGYIRDGKYYLRVNDNTLEDIYLNKGFKIKSSRINHKKKLEGWEEPGKIILGSEYIKGIL